MCWILAHNDSAICLSDSRINRLLIHPITPAITRTFSFGNRLLQTTGLSARNSTSQSLPHTYTISDIFSCFNVSPYECIFLSLLKGNEFHSLFYSFRYLGRIDPILYIILVGSFHSRIIPCCSPLFTQIPCQKHNKMSRSDCFIGSDTDAEYIRNVL